MEKYKNLIFISLAVLIVISPNIYYIFVGQEIESTPRKIGFLIFSISLLLVPIFFFTNKLRLYFTLLLPFVVLSPLNIFFLYLYKYPVTVGILGAILETNANESIEFISGFKTAAIVVIAVTVFYTLLYLYAIRKINKSFDTKYTLILSFMFLLYIIFAYYAPRPLQIENERSTKLEIFETRVLKSYPLGIVVNLAKYIKESDSINSRQELINTVTINTRNETNDKERELFILIIGETARYHSFSINNIYPRDTNPLLHPLDNLISYSDVCSLATITRMSIPLLLTRANAHNYPSSFSEPSIITFFKKAGFKTHWVSNQNRLGINEKTIKTFVYESDNVIYINEGKPIIYGEHYKYDEELIPVLNTILTQNKTNKLFIILHTLGSHYRYDFRHPPSYEVFKPSMKGLTGVRFDDPSTKEIKINSYDNSILYTDYFILSVINTVASHNSVGTVLYISDHGEDIFDDSRNLFGHGNRIVTPYVAYVPLIVWFSDQYLSKYPQKIESLIKNKDKKISAGNLLSSVLDMADVEYRGMVLSKSIFSSKLKFLKREIITSDYKILDCDKDVK